MSGGRRAMESGARLMQPTVTRPLHPEQTSSEASAHLASSSQPRAFTSAAEKTRAARPIPGGPKSQIMGKFYLHFVCITLHTLEQILLTDFTRVSLCM